MLQAIFLDRDGVINRERADYVKAWEEMELLPGVLPALGRLARLPVPICVISNQSAIGRGIVTEQTVCAMHRRLRDTIAAQGGRIDAFFVCPHRPEDGCNCRKPKPGLLLQAAERYNLSLAHCVFIGDSYTDHLAAESAGCPFIGVESGRQGPKLRGLLHDAAQLGAEQVQMAVDLAAATEIVIQTYGCPIQTA